jgi:hypothetical protein
MVVAYHRNPMYSLYSSLKKKHVRDVFNSTKKRGMVWWILSSFSQQGTFFVDPQHHLDKFSS